VFCYCSSDCQKNHWRGGHNNICEHENQRRLQYELVIFRRTKDSQDIKKFRKEQLAIQKTREPPTTPEEDAALDHHMNSIKKYAEESSDDEADADDESMPDLEILQPENSETSLPYDGEETKSESDTQERDSDSSEETKQDSRPDISKFAQQSDLTILLQCDPNKIKDRKKRMQLKVGKKQAIEQLAHLWKVFFDGFMQNCAALPPGPIDKCTADWFLGNLSGMVDDLTTMMTDSFEKIFFKTF